MIVLSKDKIDERYNIDDNGIITDLNGNVQKLAIYNGRLFFKGQRVHKIQMWTHFGWRNGNKWHIHHIDENKLNNNINNLEFLSRKEHTSLHMKGKILSEETKKKISKSRSGIPMSDEAKKKLSEFRKGGPGYNLGMKFSEETKKKMSESQKKAWIKRKGKSNV